MSKKNSNQNGITLIALVVTIIVLIILATISINAVLGENGLIKKAEQAKEIQANAEAKEAEEMNKLAEELKTANWDFSKVTKITSEDNVYVPVPKGYVASTYIDCRTGRGAYYYHTGSYTPSTNRNVYPTDSRIFVGSRATLYITQ